MCWFFFCLFFTPGSYFSILKGIVAFRGSSCGFAALKFVGCSGGASLVALASLQPPRPQKCHLSHAGAPPQPAVTVPRV